MLSPPEPSEPHLFDGSQLLQGVLGQAPAGHTGQGRVGHMGSVRVTGRGGPDDHGEITVGAGHTGSGQDGTQRSEQMSDTQGSWSEPSSVTSRIGVKVTHCLPLVHGHCWSHRGHRPLSITQGLQVRARYIKGKLCVSTSISFSRGEAPERPLKSIGWGCLEGLAVNAHRCHNFAMAGWNEVNWKKGEMQRRLAQ